MYSYLLQERSGESIVKHAKLFFRSPLLVGLVVTASCLAGEPQTKLLACRDLTDPAARLACFDRESAHEAGAPAESQGAAPATPAASPPGSSPAAQTPAAPVAAPAATAPAAVAAPAVEPAAVSRTPAVRPAAVPSPLELFGLPQGVVEKKELAAGTVVPEMAKMEARLTKITELQRDLVMYTLDNGQVWRQITSTKDLLLNPGDTVTIVRGLLHSYTLRGRTGRECKVKRVR